VSAKKKKKRTEQPILPAATAILVTAVADMDRQLDESRRQQELDDWKKNVEGPRLRRLLDRVRAALPPGVTLHCDNLYVDDPVSAFLNGERIRWSLRKSGASVSISSAIELAQELGVHDEPDEGMPR
jgi:hypothetical protein